VVGQGVGGVAAAAGTCKHCPIARGDAVESLRGKWFSSGRQDTALLQHFACVATGHRLRFQETAQIKLLDASIPPPSAPDLVATGIRVVAVWHHSPQHLGNPWKGHASSTSGTSTVPGPHHTPLQVIKSPAKTRHQCQAGAASSQPAMGRAGASCGAAAALGRQLPPARPWCAGMQLAYIPGGKGKGDGMQEGQVEGISLH
jgi:hypothetical protein